MAKRAAKVQVAEPEAQELARNPWLGYRKAHTIHLDFEDLGCPEFWVDLLQPTSQPWGELREMGSEFKREELEGEDVDPETAQRAATFVDEQLVKAIIGWNITHPVTYERLPLPKDDPEVLNILPGDFVIKLQKKLQSLLEEAVPPGKEA